MITFEEFRTQTTDYIKRNNTVATEVRHVIYNTERDDVLADWYIEHRERLKTDEEFLTFFKQHFGEEL